MMKRTIIPYLVFCFGFLLIPAIPPLLADFTGGNLPPPVGGTFGITGLSLTASGNNGFDLYLTNQNPYSGGLNAYMFRQSGTYDMSALGSYPNLWVVADYSGRPVGDEFYLCTGGTEYTLDASLVTGCPVASCSPSTVTNGTVGSYPSCTITCNAGYYLSGSTCLLSSTPPPTGTTATSSAMDVQTPMIVIFSLVVGMCVIMAVKICQLFIK